MFRPSKSNLNNFPKSNKLNFFFVCLFHFVGERPEAMQTGTSTYFADKNYIMHTLLVATIISIYNIFRDYYSSILIDLTGFYDVT